MNERHFWIMQGGTTILLVRATDPATAIQQAVRELDVEPSSITAEPVAPDTQSDLTHFDDAMRSIREELTGIGGLS